MKKNKALIGTLCLLLVSPYLMAASKYSPTSEYSYLSHTVEEITPPDYENGRLYEFTLKNEGSGYISYYQTFKYEATGFDKVSTQPIVKESIFKSTPLIMPKEEFKIQLGTTSDFTHFETGNWSTYAYVDRDSFEYDEALTFIEGERENTYLIDYEMTDLLNLRDYDYYFAVSIRYDEVKYCLLCKLGENDRICFYTKEGFDPSKAKIVNVERFRVDVYNGPNYAAFALGGALLVLIQMAIGGFILFNLIFIPILIHRIIRKKEMSKNKE